MTDFLVKRGLSYPHPSGGHDALTYPHPTQDGQTIVEKRPREKHANAGDVVSDLPEKSIPWLLEHGHIEIVTGGVAVSAPPPPEEAAAPTPAPELAPKKAKKEEKAS
jgi:hypothetical protein